MAITSRNAREDWSEARIPPTINIEYIISLTAFVFPYPTALLRLLH